MSTAAAVWLGILGVVAVAAFGYWNWHRRPVRVPEGKVAAPLAWAGADNIPVIGIYTRLKSVITDPVALVVRNQAKYGDIFTLRVPSIYDFTFLLDGEHYRQILSLPTQHAGIGHVLDRVPTIGYWFPRERSGPETLQQLILLGRQLMADMLPASRLAELSERIPGIVKRHTAAWSPTVDLTEAMHPIIYEVTGRHFTGDRIWDELGARLTGYYRNISNGIDIVRTTLSITPYHFVMPEYRSTRKLYAMLRDELPAFAEADSPLLRAIAAARLDGKPLTPADQRWMFMYVLWNATAYPGTYGYWTLMDIKAHPALLSRVHTEPDAGKRQRLLARCLLESIRMHPVSSLIRYLQEPYEFVRDGKRWHIPAGQAVGVFPGTLNRDPDRVSGNPHDYDPDRYRRAPAPQVASYGRGPFGCVAQKLTEVAIAGVLDEVLRNFDIDLPDALPIRRERIHQIYPGSPSLARITNR